MRFLRIPGRSRRSLTASAVALAAALHPIPSPAAPGDLDATFGSGGIALVAAGANSSAEAVVVQGDGKIVAAGYVSGSSVDMAVVRLDSTGALDSSFGTGGVVTLPASMQSITHTAAIQPDGGILVGGGVVADPELDYDFRIARLLPADGQLDSTFGTGGIVVTPAAGTVGANSVVVQPDGKILAGGDGKRNVLSGSKNRDFVVHRYLADGSSDTSFGAAGRSVISMGRRFDAVRTLLLQPDGAILAVGYAAGGRSGRTALVRLATDGILDPTFGRHGRQQLRLVTPREFGADAALLADGRIVTGGESVDPDPNSFSSNITLSQFTSSGTLDPALGTDGVSSVRPFSLSYNHVERIALQADGRIVAVGSVSGLNDPPDLFLARFLPDGSLDSSFGSGGVARTLVGTQDQAAAVAIQPDGGIVVAGVALVSGQARMLVARYLP